MEFSFEQHGQAQPGQSHLFDKGLSVREVMESTKGLFAEASASDRVLAALAGGIGTAIFFIISFSGLI